jgi:hypothetical protein
MMARNCIRNLKKNTPSKSPNFGCWSPLAPSYLGNGKSYNNSVAIFQIRIFKRNSLGEKTAYKSNFK